MTFELDAMRLHSHLSLRSLHMWLASSLSSCVGAPLMPSTPNRVCEAGSRDRTVSVTATFFSVKSLMPVGRDLNICVMPMLASMHTLVITLMPLGEVLTE